MKPLRIAMLSPIHWRTPPRKYGPWEQVASNIAEELVRRGHDVTLYATADSATSAKLRSVVPYGLLEEAGKNLDGGLWSRLHAAACFEDAARGEFDIIHNHYDGYPLTMSRLINTPVVSTVHGFSSGQIHELYRRYDNVSYVSISKADRKNCPDMNWVANVYHGLHLADWPYAANSQDWIGFIGRIHPSKGTHLAIEAAKRAGRNLRIAGAIDEQDPVVAKYWHKEIEPHIDGRHVQYLGELGGPEKLAFYQQAQAILAPILWDEPFGLVLIEAMAVGTPVVAYGRGSVPEVVRDGVSGWVVPPNDLEALAAAIGRVDQLDRKAVRAHVEQYFAVETMVDGYEAVYRDVLQGRRL